METMWAIKQYVKNITKYLTFPFWKPVQLFYWFFFSKKCPYCKQIMIPYEECAGMYFYMKICSKCHKAIKLISLL
ncbi:MAG: hypothetical protein ACFFG0_27380 [Candidatus Thorarchaeota archaeon]